METSKNKIIKFKPKRVLDAFYQSLISEYVLLKNGGLCYVDFEVKSEYVLLENREFSVKMYVTRKDTTGKLIESYWMESVVLACDFDRKTTFEEYFLNMYSEIVIRDPNRFVEIIGKEESLKLVDAVEEVLARS